MDVTRTVWFEGSVDEFRTLQRMLEEEGIRVELPLWVRDRERQQETLDQVRRRLDFSSGAMDQWLRADIEAIEREEREELEQLLLRQGRERQELEQRHEHERQELKEGYRRRSQRLETTSNLVKGQAQLQAELTWILADVNQVIVSLVSTGAALAIADAVKKFRKQHPRSKVEVMGEKVEKEKKKPRMTLAITRAIKKFRKEHPRSEVEVVGDKKD